MSDDSGGEDNNVVPMPPKKPQPGDLQAELVRRIMDGIKPVFDALNGLVSIVGDLVQRVAALERRPQLPSREEFEAYVARLVRAELDRRLDGDDLRDQISLAVIQESGSVLSNLLDERGYPYRHDPGRQ
jgi:hypothetical protein